MIRFTNTNTTHFQSSVMIKAPTPGGRNPGGPAIGFPTNPLVMDRYVITVITNGPNTNGINKNGFRMIGAPKMIGSLMPNREVTIPTVPIDFNDFALERIIIATRSRVSPEPVTWRTA